MYLLDTDVLIWAIRGRTDIVEIIESLTRKSSTCISTISIAEIYKNVFPSEITSTDEYLVRHLIFPIDVSIAKQGGLYWQQFTKKLKNLSLDDCLVAATAKIHDMYLVSLNTRHFPMRDIKVLDPLKKKTR